MDFFIDGVDTLFSLTLTCDAAVTYDTTTGTARLVDIKTDKDWMPYNHFEYDPLWHKKYAAIKYQMEKMWD